MNMTRLVSKALCKVPNDCKLGLQCRNCVKTDDGDQFAGHFFSSTHILPVTLDQIKQIFFFL